MMKESDKHYEYLRAYIAENEYAKRNKLNNSNYNFA